MLTMGKPIQLNTARPMETIGDDFANRIIGNYGMMQEKMTSTELLHFIASPPEVYMGEGGMAPLVMNSSTSYSQDFNIDMINNVLNRIVLSENNHLTYQDRVYIENVLNKVGITNVSEFMRQVRMTQEETKNTKQLLQLYMQGQDSLELVKEYLSAAGSKANDKSTDQLAETDREQILLDMSQQITNRLHTEEIYQEIAHRVIDYAMTTNHISNVELQLSEQSINADYMTLNRMRQETFNQNNNLVYSRLNAYEAGDVTEQEETYNETVTNMIQALLLSAVSQVFHNRYDELIQKNVNWHNLTDTLHVLSENTFKRYETYHNRTNLTEIERNEYYRSLQNIQHNEINTLQRLIENTNNFNRVENINNQTQVEENLDYRLEPTYVTSQEVTEEIEESLKQQTDQHKHVYNISKQQETQALINQLNIINQQNIERVQRLKSFEANRSEEKPKKPNMQQARADGLRAITEGTDLAMEYLTRENNTTIERQQYTESLKEIIGQDTVNILQMMEGYKPTAGQGRPRVVTEGAAMDLLVQDASAVSQQKGNATSQETALDNTKVLRETSKEVEQVLKETERIRQVEMPAAQRRIETNRRQVELFHKQNETAITEELLEELQSKNSRTVENRTIENTEQVIETHKVDEIINNRVKELKLQQNQEVEQLITNNVRQQLGILSDQVYNKLEKKIDSERRRRGM